jgi:integrase
MSTKQKRTPGLIKRCGVWHIDKQIGGQRICESTGTGDLAEALRQLARRIDQIRQAAVYGVRPRRTFREAATKYLTEAYKRSIGRDAQDLRIVVPYIGALFVDEVHMGTLQSFVNERRAQGVKSATVNRTLAIVRRILNLAARMWRDEHGLTWLETPPMIQLQDWEDRRPPYPLSWDEQALLFRRLPAYLAKMALFKVNTGTREQEVCGLRWDWEERVPELGTTVFVVPGLNTKNKEDRLIVLNQTARSVVGAQRGKDRTWVFPYDGRRLSRMYNKAWRQARREASEVYEGEIGGACPKGFQRVRVHDLKHTFGRRLRSVGVSLETRKVLLGYKNGDITTHYSAPEITELLDAAERVSERPAQSQGLVLLKGSARA